MGALIVGAFGKKTELSYCAFILKLFEQELYLEFQCV